MRVACASAGLIAFATFATATTVHNNFSSDGIMHALYDAVFDLPAGGSADVGGGFGVFAVAASVCTQDFTTYTWPITAEDVFIGGDGFLHDAAGDIIGSSQICA